MVAAAEAELVDWVPAKAADAAGCAAASMVPPSGGAHYNAMVAPFSLTSVRAVMWAPPPLPTIAAADQACLFRAMINGWRDAQPVGDYAFLFVQESPANNRAIATAAAQSAALPRPAVALGGAMDAIFADKQDVDTTGVAVTPSGTLADSMAHEVGYRLSLALMHVAFAKQPPSKYSGPVLKSAAWKGKPQRIARLLFGSVSPGKLTVLSSDGFVTNKCSGHGLDVRFATSAELDDPATRMARASVVLGNDGHSLIATLDDTAVPMNYTVVIFVGGAECRLVGTTSPNLSAPVAGVRIASAQGLKSNDRMVPKVQRKQQRHDTHKEPSMNASLFATPPLGA
eukprot:SAG31_NODE_122_length_23797_cov_39.343812_8_plen_341_part_00